MLWTNRYDASVPSTGRDIALGADGSVVVTGYFTGVVDFGDDVVRTSAAREVFVLGLDAAGNTLWSTSFGSTAVDYGTGVDVASDGVVYVSGVFGGELVLGDEVHTARAYDDAFVVQIHPPGP